MARPRGWDPISLWASGIGPIARRLGEAILDMLKALRGLGFEAVEVVSNHPAIPHASFPLLEVQTRFCESVASSLLPYLEDKFGAAVILRR